MPCREWVTTGLMRPFCASSLMAARARLPFICSTSAVFNRLQLTTNSNGHCRQGPRTRSLSDNTEAVIILYFGTSACSFSYVACMHDS